MKRRGPHLAVKTALQGHLIWLVFASLAVPTVLFGGGMFLLMRYPSGLTDMPPAVFEVRVLLASSVLFPVLVALLLWWAFHLTNRMVGPVERMTQELDARLRGTASGPIALRPKDMLLPLAEKINLLVADLEKLRKSQR